METIVKQLEALQLTVKSTIFGLAQSRLLLLLEKFDKALAKLSEASEFSDTPGSGEISELNSEKEEIDEGDASEWSGQEIDGEEAQERQGAELMACMLCEIEETDSVEPNDVEHNKTISHKNYANWKELSQHIKEKHCILDSSLVQKGSYVIQEGQLAHGTGQIVKSMHIISKYCVIKCLRCESRFNTGISFKNGYLKLCCHMHLKHSQPLAAHVKLYQCISCSYNSHSDMLLARHVEYNHSGVKNKYNQKVYCPACGKSVLQRFLTQHMAVVHNLAENIKGSQQQKVICTVCSKEYSSKKNLERHTQRVHGKVRDFLCHLCSCSFYEKKDLINHMYTKHRANPHGKSVLHCQAEGCDFTALTKDAVSRHHALSHGSTSSFVCSHCGKKFNAAHNLKQHEEVMHSTGLKKYRCDQCSFHTHVHQYLRRHMKIHSNAKKHRCSFAGCDYKTHFSENLKKHQKIHSPHHQLCAKTKKDHNYIKPIRKSSKQASSSVCIFTEQSGTPLNMNQQPDLLSTSDHYLTYDATRQNLPMHASGYQQIVPIGVKQEAYSAKGTGLINSKLPDAAPSEIEAVNTISEANQFYQCHQQFDDLSKTPHSYLSL